MEEKERIALFTGHFGSGKTELAVNYSLLQARKGNKTVIVDLDIVNPFFRSSELNGILNAQNVRLISPNFAGTTVDVPSLSSQINTVFQDKDYKVIFDVGGDDIGATALGRFYPYFSREAYSMFYVINVRRPMSGNKMDIINMLKAVEAHSRLKVTDLVNNTNLSYETQVHDIIEGNEIITQVSQELGIPVSCVAGIPRVLEGLPHSLKKKAFPLELFMRPPWEPMELGE